MSFDLVIKNGTVVDGSGRPRYRADVAVRDGTIAEMGTVTERCNVEIDAEGHFVSPGFIDMHTHLDAQVNWDPLGPAAWHGVTSVVMGNCGFTLAPCLEENKDLVLRNFERAEDMPREALLEGVPWRWTSFAEYLDHVDSLPKGINYAGMVGHSAIRTHVMGERAFEDGGLRDGDLEQMCAELEASIAAGALGLSSSSFAHHFTSDDRPVASRQATWDEIHALVSVLAEADRGVFQMTAGELQADNERDQSDKRRFRDLAVASRRPVIPISVFVPPDELLALSDETAGLGGQMVIEASIKAFELFTGFKTRLPFDALPSWSEMRSKPLEQQRAMLLDVDHRKQLLHEASTTEVGSTVGAMPRAPEWDRLSVRGSGCGPWPTVAQVARERGTDPLETLIDLSIESDFEQLFTQPVTTEYPDDVWIRKMRHPRTMVGISDAGAHLSQALQYDVPTYLLAHWVRDKNVFTWEEGVRLLTFDIASIWGFSGRGLLREGNAADIVIFDPATIAPGYPRAIADLPGGATRLVEKGEGILATVVNGEVVFSSGEQTGALPGRLLRGGPRRAR